MRTTLLATLALTAALTACRTTKDGGGGDSASSAVDADGDGVNADSDCDDDDASISPEAEEICDGVDNDCDGEVDEELLQQYFMDVDEDGWGDSLVSVEACEAPSGHVAQGGDCDDRNEQVHPDATERCNGEDDDCDDDIDEEVQDTWYADGDGDGYGDADAPYDDCDPPPGYVADDTDCDDTTALASPEGTEVCDELDNDCDGDVDEDVTTTYYQDADGDGYGDPSLTAAACSVPDGYADSGGDCDDADIDVNPDATEVCDEVDNDCDGDVDEDDADDAATWYADGDSDGYGDASSTSVACDQPSGFVSDDTDCDDAESTTNPGATEYCDSVDNDCDGSTDEDDAADASTWYGDSDGDGYGGSTFVQTSCSQPSNYVSTSTDCDDLDASSYPGATEVCDEADNDCDGSTDEGLGSTWYADSDGDGDGDPSSTTTACDQPTGYVSNSDDCDDTDASATTGATEVCDGSDNDCDGIVDNDEDTLGEDASCPANSCLDILSERSSVADGVYYVDVDGAGDIVDVWCEMDVDGGGWMAVFNYMDPQSESNSDAADFHSAITANADMTAAVEPDATSSSIHTSNVDLSAYTEVLYGWAPSDSDDVSRYAVHTDTSGLSGKCYIDGYCGSNVSMGSMDVVPTGSTRTFYTGNNPSYPHVGIGWSSQIICWGFDNNDSSYGHWANWYDTKSCCTSGNTSAVQTAGWRYTVYLR